jgi:hypothetical protein
MDVGENFYIAHLCITHGAAFAGMTLGIGKAKLHARRFDLKHSHGAYGIPFCDQWRLLTGQIERITLQRATDYMHGTATRLLEHAFLIYNAATLVLSQSLRVSTRPLYQNRACFVDRTYGSPDANSDSPSSAWTDVTVISGITYQNPLHLVPATLSDRKGNS